MLMEQQTAEVVSLFHGTFWALVPSVVAIVLALITKEAYSSLFIGVVIGGLFISQGSFPQFLDAVFKNGMVKQVSDPWNVGILFFLVMLGAMVALMNKSGAAAAFMNFMPAIIFLVGIGLAFSTGTSWGTFGILIPIVVAAFSSVDPDLMIISISACMAGAVCGDHISPISDTTIMASAGAQCNHVNHVNTQLPYALSVASISFICYVVAGFTRSALLSFALGVAFVVGALFIVKKKFS